MSEILIPTDAQLSKILGRKLPADLLRMVKDKPEVEPLPGDMDRGWKREVGLLILPPA